MGICFSDEGEVSVAKISANDAKETPPATPITRNESYSSQRIGFAQSVYPSQQQPGNGIYSAADNYSQTKMNNYSGEKSDAMYPAGNSHKEAASVYAVPATHQANGHVASSSPQKTSAGTLSSSHYRNLQNSGVISSRGQIQTNFNQRSGTLDSTQRKRYHTSPREKHRVGTLGARELLQCL